MILKYLREIREPNFFVEHSHLGVIIWKLINSYNSLFKAEKIEDYYRELYDDDNNGFQNCISKFKKNSKPL